MSDQENLSDDELSLCRDIVAYIVIRTGKGDVIRKSEIVKDVIQLKQNDKMKATTFNRILSEVSTQLLDNFGLKLIDLSACSPDEFRLKREPKYVALSDIGDNSILTNDSDIENDEFYSFAALTSAIVQINGNRIELNDLINQIQSVIEDNYKLTKDKCQQLIMTKMVNNGYLKSACNQQNTADSATWISNGTRSCLEFEIETLSFVNKVIERGEMINE
ncbi:hypothetical protein GJ496_009447 [Pomphorhynchus laevis]|nr:hypothetical protein GJ496_009447 [Pomphorhynchus laevis]